jgi:hypothetical protein
MIKEKGIIAQKDMEVLGVFINQGNEVKKINDSMISITKIVEIGYFDSDDFINELNNKNNEE